AARAAARVNLGTLSLLKSGQTNPAAAYAKRQPGRKFYRSSRPVSGAMGATANARSRPLPATCDASTRPLGDHPRTDGRGPRQSPLPAPDAASAIPQGAALWTCSGVLLSQVSA